MTSSATTLTKRKIKDEPSASVSPSPSLHHNQAGSEYDNNNDDDHDDDEKPFISKRAKLVNKKSPSKSTATPTKAKTPNKSKGSTGPSSTSSSPTKGDSWTPESRLRLFEAYQVCSAVKWDDVAEAVSRYRKPQASRSSSWLGSVTLKKDKEWLT